MVSPAMIPQTVLVLYMMAAVEAEPKLLTNVCSDEMMVMIVNMIMVRQEDVVFI